MFEYFYTGKIDNPEYRFPVLTEIQFIQINHHLPNIPSAEMIQGKKLRNCICLRLNRRSESNNKKEPFPL